jgi:glycosyltransferase 2 family protein
MNRAAWTRLLGGAAVLGIVLWRVGTGPVVEGLRSVDVRSVVLALAIGLSTTLCCAWRWRLVAGELGLRIDFRDAVSAYYRSQFLNSVLPGGVLGDVHRGVSHGRAARDTGGGLRAVVWERVAGQTVSVVLAVAVLALLPSPARWPLLLVGGGLLAIVLLAVLWTAGVRRHWPAITAASVVAMTGHVATFFVAARTAGASASLVTLLPLALLVLLAMAVPANVAGWGPREGMAAWVFAAAGLGAAQGVATAVVYGVITFVATLPGVTVLLVSPSRVPEPVGGVHG